MKLTELQDAWIKAQKNEGRNRQIHNCIFQYYSPFTVIELIENQQRFIKNYKWWESCMGVGMWLSVISMQEKKNKCKTRDKIRIQNKLWNFQVMMANWTAFKNPIKIILKIS